jgi:hypothetical protein
MKVDHTEIARECGVGLGSVTGSTEYHNELNVFQFNWLLNSHPHNKDPSPWF